MKARFAHILVWVYLKAQESLFFSLAIMFLRESPSTLPIVAESPWPSVAVPGVALPGRDVLPVALPRLAVDAMAVPRLRFCRARGISPR